METQKFEYLKNEKSFLDEIKIFFTVFEGLSFGEKYKFDKKQWTQTLTCLIKYELNLQKFERLPVKLSKC